MTGVVLTVERVYRGESRVLLHVRVCAACYADILGGFYKGRNLVVCPAVQNKTRRWEAAARCDFKIANNVKVEF